MVRKDAIRNFEQFEHLNLHCILFQKLPQEVYYHIMAILI